MTVVEFLSKLRKLNVNVWIDNDLLRYQAPPGVLTSELFAELTQQKAEIINFLKQIHHFSSIEPAPKQDYYPVSAAQKRFYILNKLEGVETSYNISGAVKIEGKLDRNRLEEVFQKLISRHEAFRTTFELKNDELVQRIHAQIDFQIDYQEIDEKNAAAEIDRFIQPFDLSRVPLLRAKLFRVAAEKHILLFNMDHIISDGVSMVILLRDFASLYHGEIIPPLPLQYKDYTVWTNNLGADILKQQEKYWLEIFSGPINEHHLPSDFPRPTVMNFKGETEIFTFSEELSAGLRLLAAERKATLFMALLAGYNLWLSRLTGAEEIYVGTTVAGRQHAQLENVIGMFLNTLVLKNHPKPQHTFYGFLEEVKHNCAQAFENQDYQFETLLDNLKISRDFSRNPIFDTLLNSLDDTLDYQLEVDGLQLSPYEFTRNTATFDLLINISEIKNRIQLKCNYRTCLFKRSTIHYFMNEYIRLLEAIIRNPEKRLEEYRLFDPKDLQTAPSPVRVNIPHQDFPREAVDRSIIERFEAQVKLYPDKIAAQIGAQSIGYDRLNRKANQVARVIQKEPVTAKPVALLFRQNPDMFTGIIGVLKAGRAYLPLDPTYPKERLAYMLSDSKAASIITDTFNLPLAAELVKKVNSKIRIIDINQLNPKIPDQNLDLTISPETVAYIKYTSGSTGKPKGIPQTHRNVLAFIRRYTHELSINADDKVALFTSYSHSAGAIDIFSMLLNGGALFPYDLKADGMENVSEWLAKENITIFHSVPMVFRYCTENLAEGEIYPRIRLVVLGGEPVSQKDVGLFHQCFDKNCVLVNMFGATEVIIGTFYLMDQKAELGSSLVPIGYPVEEIKIYLVDESNREVPVYGVGEIIYESDYLALDYLNLPEKSAEVYVTNPITGQGRVFRSGDLGRMLPDGRLEFLGRKDFQVKIRGYRIELGEIEAALDNLPGIHKSVVSEYQKAEENYLAAYYTTSGGNELDKIEIRRWLGRQLPDYMIPSYFVHLEQFPLTPNGKIDRKMLPEPEVLNTDSEVKYEAPRNEIEVALVKIWEEILRVEKIGIDDNFFELGGHSLKLSYLANRIYKEFTIEIKLSELFTASTIRLAAELILRKKTDVNKIEAALKRIKNLTKT